MIVFRIVHETLPNQYDAYFGIISGGHISPFHIVNVNNALYRRDEPLEMHTSGIYYVNMPDDIITFSPHLINISTDFNLDTKEDVLSDTNQVLIIRNIAYNPLYTPIARMPYLKTGMPNVVITLSDGTNNYDINYPELFAPNISSYSEPNRNTILFGKSYFFYDVNNSITYSKQFGLFLLPMQTVRFDLMIVRQDTSPNGFTIINSLKLLLNKTLSYPHVFFYVVGDNMIATQPTSIGLFDSESKVVHSETEYLKPTAHGYESTLSINNNVVTSFNNEISLSSFFSFV
ncbi:MAG: hypothetical protein QXF12_08160 [Candidatus Aenigmatarchaeota archaeon]